MINPIPKDMKRSWTVILNGEVIDDVESLVIEHPNFGSVRYGLRPEGYDGWLAYQPGGGGSVAMPYLIKDRRLYVGVVEEKREPAGGIVLNVPRGYIDPGETHLQAAVRETSEETGFNAASRMVAISAGTNIDNSIFVAKDGDGVHYFAFEVFEEEVEYNGSYNVPTFKFKGDLQPKTGIGEKIHKCIFFPYDWCVNLNDQFTLTGLSKLEKYLRVEKGLTNLF